MKNLLTQEHILKSIEGKITNGSTYIDSIVDFCSKNDLEIESVGEVIKKSSILKDKIKEEGVKLLLVKK